jgi:hypothetical protein
MNRILIAVVGALIADFGGSRSAVASVVAPREEDRVAAYHLEGLYDMVGLGSWNGQPVSEANQPSIWTRRLAGDVSCYRDSESDRTLWITVTGIVTSQGASWSGSPSRDVQLTGLGFGFASASGSVVATNYRGDFALAGQQVLTSAGSTPIETTPGYGMSIAGETTWIRCNSGTDYGMTNFGWVSGLTVLTGSAVFQLELSQSVQSIDWSRTSLLGRFGVDHQFIEGSLVPAPGTIAALGYVGFSRRRRR